MIYNSCYECRVYFSVYPQYLHPDIITEILNIYPTKKNVKDEFRTNSKGKKIKIKKNSWFLISDSEVKSKDFEKHMIWVINKIKEKKNLPYYIKKKLETFPISDDRISNFDKCIEIGIDCSWYPMYDHGGPILSPEIMASLSQINVDFSLNIYFTHTISTVQGFMEAAEVLNIGKDLTHHDWLHILAFIKKFHNIPPSTLGTVCRNGDYLDDDGNVICNIRDYVS